MNDMNQFLQSTQPAEGTADQLGRVPFPEENTITWGEALQGLNPIGWPPWDRPFWRSFGRAMKDSATGIPQLPKLITSLAKEFPNLPKLPGVLKDNFGEGAEFLDEVEKAGMPVLAALMEDYMNRYGSLEGFKRTLATDPFAILMDALPQATALKGVKIAGRLGKVVRGVGKTAGTLDKVTNLPGAGMEKLTQLGLRGAKQKFAMDPESYNIPIEIQTGMFDEATGRPITRSVTPSELAEELSRKSGTTVKPEDVPIQALTDNEIPITFEEVLRKTEAEIAPKLAAEYDAAGELIKGTQQELISKYPSQFKKYWNPSSVGDHLIGHYIKTRKGEKGSMGELFEKNKADLDIPLRRTDTPDVSTLRINLPSTEAFIEELLADYDGKIENVTHPDIKSTIETYNRIVDTLSNIENPTYNTLRQLRTDFGGSVNLFARKDGILKTGGGNVSKRLYNEITQDIFDTLEASIVANPDKFPEAMADRVRAAETEWRNGLALEDSEAANWLLNNANDPGGMMDKILARENTLVDTEITNLKTLLGAEWGTFQKGLLNRLFERSMEADGVKPVGLKTQIENINHKNKSQLVQLFGEDTAKMLNDIAAFRERVFGRKGQWNTRSAQEIIHKYLKDPAFANLISATGLMSDATAQAVYDAAQKANRIVDISGVQLAAAINFIFAGGVYISERATKKRLVSGSYRKWMTVGHSFPETPVRIAGKEFQLSAQSFQDLSDFVEKHGWKTFYPGKIAARTRRAENQREERKASSVFNPRNPLDDYRSIPVE